MGAPAKSVAASRPELRLIALGSNSSGTIPLSIVLEVPPKQASADAQQHSDNDQRRVSQYAHVRTCSSGQEDNEPRGAEDCHEPTPIHAVLEQTAR